MHIIAKDQTAQFSCVISNKIIASCNVTSCMWHCKNFNHNCSATDSNINELDLGVVKGYSPSAIAKEVRKGKASIQKILILDSYVAWVKAQKLKVKIYNKKELRELFASSVLCNKAFNIDYKDFAICCNLKTFERYTQSVNVKLPKLSLLLGIREQKLNHLNSKQKVIP